MTEDPISVWSQTTKTGLILFAVLALLIGFAAWKMLYGNSPVSIGGNRDEHGCLPAAGYSWCESKNKCIRQWEEYCTATPPKTAIFNCADSKTITAVFYPGDDKFVDLDMGDGRKLSVPRAVSASGARYANSDESFVFWNKGDTAFVTENGTTTFDGCLTSSQ